MAILKIRKYGEDILEKKCERINFNLMESKLPKIIDDMTQTCLAMQGVGLAAPQVGLNMSLAVIMLPVDENGPSKPESERLYKRYVLINPEISSSKGVVDSEEGCLSFPGLEIKIERAKEVKVKCLNENGLPVEIQTSGPFAIVLQHEIDHLYGRTFIDRLYGEAKKDALDKIKELRRRW